MDHPERLKRRRDDGAGGATTPARRFDVTVGAITAKEHVADDETEDTALTDYLMRAWLELNNPHATPVPRCPHCDGLRIRPNPGKALITFFCHACRKSFNRFTGTPFAGLGNRAKGTAMIPLLSRQMSMLQAGERLGRTPKAILSWLLAFRRYLLELDPDGRWEARVRLGVRVAPQAQCTRCGFEGGFNSGGFDPQGRRRIRCPQCGRSRLLDALQGEGQGFAGVVVHDAIDTALRVRRKVHPNTPEPEIVRAAQVDDAAPEVSGRKLPRLDDVVLPQRYLSPGPVERREDPLLSRFLLARIDAALAPGSTCEPCPWCGSGRTDYHPAPRPNGLPGFKCRACLAYFTRVSNTPLNATLAREYARRFVPLLGWRETARAAAQELGVDPNVLGRWLRAWRQWLLLIDPGGSMEGRVRLGLATAPMVRNCAACGHTGPVTLVGSVPVHSAPAGQRRIRYRCRQCGRNGRAWRLVGTT